MSALSFRRRRQTEVDGFVSCVGAPDCGSRAKWKAEIFGWPAGLVCDTHKRSWSKSWQESLDAGHEGLVTEKAA